MTIIADSSPLICFAILNRLNVLSIIFEDLIVPKAVYDEVTITGKPFAEILKKFLEGKVIQVQNKIRFGDALYNKALTLAGEK